MVAMCKTFLFSPAGCVLQVMELFVTHVCLIRPLGEGGKLRVAMDLAHLELVLGLFCRGDIAIQFRTPIQDATSPRVISITPWRYTVFARM